MTLVNKHNPLICGLSRSFSCPSNLVRVLQRDTQQMTTQRLSQVEVGCNIASTIGTLIIIVDNSEIAAYHADR